jgi:hypothetical protein
MSSLHDGHYREEDWPYDDPPNVAVFTTRSIISDNLLIKYVYHDDSDGAWQFYASRGDINIDDVILVSLENITRRDPSVTILADLPYGWFAYRANAADEWHRGINPDEN